MMHYLKKKSKIELVFWGNLRSFMGYIDIDLARNIATQRSISEFLFIIKSGIINRLSK